MSCGMAEWSRAASALLMLTAVLTVASAGARPPVVEYRFEAPEALGKDTGGHDHPARVVGGQQLREPGGPGLRHLRARQ